MPGNLPNLIVIGAMKCGTTSLHSYLAEHPQIFMSKQKELDFFIAERNWSRSIEWYRSQFPVDSVVRGESSPNYTKFPSFPDVPERMHATIPYTKLIYVVRDPIERIVSHYVHRVADGLETRSFEASLETLEDNILVDTSRYAMQLSLFHAYYAHEQILIVDLDELQNHRANTMGGVFRFLGLDDDVARLSFTQTHHVSAAKRVPTLFARTLSRIPYLNPAVQASLGASAPSFLTKKVTRPVVSEELRARLADTLKDDIARFKVVSGKDWAQWKL